MPIYEPDRERIVFANVQEANPGPLPGRDLVRIYERIIDVMRKCRRKRLCQGSRDGVGDRVGFGCE